MTDIRTPLRHRLIRVIAAPVGVVAHLGRRPGSLRRPCPDPAGRLRADGGLGYLIGAVGEGRPGVGTPGLPAVRASEPQRARQ
jgi:hypothetical protein